MVVIPVEVNGKELTFLLDTGVSSTMLFSLSEIDSIELHDAKPVRLRGLGTGGSVLALKSDHNRLKIGELVDDNHGIYVVFDKSLSLSTRMGIPIHGIIGYEFYKNLIVKTNYITRKIFVYKPESYVYQKCNKCEVFDLLFHNKKPYIKITSIFENESKESTLLIDSGSSDSVWLFDNFILEKNLNDKWFDDFLGQGLSGDIFGKRSKLPNIRIGEFELNNVKVAFPDKESIENITLFKERDGSVGGELLNRFTIIMDYPSKKISLKKNKNFKDPFHYNMSGITIEHDGVVLIKNKKENFNSNSIGDNDGNSSIRISTTFNFSLVPKYVVSEIRKESPAYLAGIQIEDELISLNGKQAHQYNLHELIGLFSSKAGKKITLKIKRNEIIYRKKFILKEVFE